MRDSFFRNNKTTACIIPIDNNNQILMLLRGDDPFDDKLQCHPSEVYLHVVEGEVFQVQMRGVIYNGLDGGMEILTGL